MEGVGNHVIRGHYINASSFDIKQLSHEYYTTIINSYTKIQIFRGGILSLNLLSPRAESPTVRPAASWCVCVLTRRESVAIPSKNRIKPLGCLGPPRGVGTMHFSTARQPDLVKLSNSMLIQCREKHRPTLLLSWSSQGY
jgi:hypothetical protein